MYKYCCDCRLLKFLTATDKDIRLRVISHLLCPLSQLELNVMLLHFPLVDPEVRILMTQKGLTRPGLRDPPDPNKDPHSVNVVFFTGLHESLQHINQIPAGPTVVAPLKSY